MGDLRLRLPVPITSYTGTINATTFGNQCIQQTQPSTTLPSTFPSAAAQRLSRAAAARSQIVPQDEDCLNVNVIAPANTTAESKLPVALVSEDVHWLRCGTLISCSCSGFTEVRALATVSRDRVLIRPDSPPLRRVCSRLEFCVSLLGATRPTVADAASREPGENVVARSIQLGHPVIFVAPNYRLNGM